MHSHQLEKNITTKRIIYDFGANNGDDIPYYLKKGDVVVAVEANPILCKQIEKRFSSEIENGKVFIENCVLTADDSGKAVFFYIHKTHTAFSQFPKPDDAYIHDFEKLLLPSQSVLSVIQRYGSPYYLKIDVEHYDEAILRTLFTNDILPPFISAESHSIEVFSLFVALGKYNSFKLVDGQTVSRRYESCLIGSSNNQELYSFPLHSAGPFGEDVAGEWMTANNFFRLLAFEGLGWKDIHATNQIQPNPTVIPRLRHYLRRVLVKTVIAKIGTTIPKPLLEMLEKYYFSLA